MTSDVPSPTTADRERDLPVPREPPPTGRYPQPATWLMKHLKNHQRGDVTPPCIAHLPKGSAMSVKTKSVKQLELEIAKLTARKERLTAEVKVTGESLKAAKAQLKEVRAANKAQRVSASSDCEE